MLPNLFVDNFNSVDGIKVILSNIEVLSNLYQHDPISMNRITELILANMKPSFIKTLIK